MEQSSKLVQLIPKDVGKGFSRNTEGPTVISKNRRKPDKTSGISDNYGPGSIR